MFSTKLGRAVPRATAALPSTSAPCTAHRTTTCLATKRSSHARRHSSSKASCPPDGSPKPAPAAKATTRDENSPDKAAAARTSPGRGNRGRKAREMKGKDLQVDAGYSGLPAVPGTQHLHPGDINLSSFFSLHRPLSLTSTFPPPTDNATFASLLQPQETKQDPWANGNSAQRRPEDVIYTLSNTIENLETPQSNEESDLRWQIIQESPSNNGEGIKHLDSPPPRTRSLEELVAQFKPFKAPPPPEPFPEDAAPTKQARNEQIEWRDLKAKLQKQLKKAAKERSYTTTIVVTESTSEDGKRTYTASSSPIVRLPDVKEQQQVPSVKEPSSTPSKQPFMDRMRQRQSAYERERRRPNTMHAISVKRQRKLKMKKHKYKKLMKRTRNLRRRLDRT